MTATLEKGGTCETETIILHEIHMQEMKMERLGFESKNFIFFINVPKSISYTIYGIRMTIRLTHWVMQ